MLTAAKQMGLGDLDCASIVAFMEKISGIDEYPWPIDAEGRPVPGKPFEGGPPMGGGPSMCGGPPGGGPPGGGPPTGGRPPGARE